MTPAERDSADQAAAQQGVAAEIIRRWWDRPVDFVRECLRIEPDAWQLDVLEAFPRERQIGGKACKGPGKTAVMSWLGWNFLATRPHPKVPCTSITGDNLADGLWTEFAIWQKRSPLLSEAFAWTKTRVFLKEEPETWFASARTWPRDGDPSAQANTLAGLHADYLLFLIDEVSEIPLGVVAAAEAALASGVETKLVMMGNPTRTDGPLYMACTRDRKNWFIIEINGDPDDPKRSPRIDIEWARQQIEKYGRDSYFVRVNILGQFPDRQADKLLDVGDVERAMSRSLPQRAWQGAPKIMGVDVARFGDDRSTFSFRQGRMMFRGVELLPPERDEAALILVGDELIRAIEKWQAHRANIDGTGVGGGVVDYVRSRGYGDRIGDVNFGSRAQDSERFENRRAEMWWRMAEWVKGGGCLPRDPLLAEELAAPIYWFDKRGRICLEDKKDIKARLGRSPDRADGAGLTFADEIGPLADLSASAVVRAEVPGHPFDDGGVIRASTSSNPFTGRAY